MIKGVVTLAGLLGAIAFFVADILRPDSGTTSAYIDSWPVQHPVYFGLAVAGAVLVLGLLVIIASNSSADRR